MQDQIQWVNAWRALRGQCQGPLTFDRQGESGAQDSGILIGELTLHVTSNKSSSRFVSLASTMSLASGIMALASSDEARPPWQRRWKYDFRGWFPNPLAASAIFVPVFSILFQTLQLPLMPILINFDQKRIQRQYIPRFEHLWSCSLVGAYRSEGSGINTAQPAPGHEDAFAMRFTDIDYMMLCSLAQTHNSYLTRCLLFQARAAPTKLPYLSEFNVAAYCSFAGDTVTIMAELPFSDLTK